VKEDYEKLKAVFFLFVFFFFYRRSAKIMQKFSLDLSLI